MNGPPGTGSECAWVSEGLSAIITTAKPLDVKHEQTHPAQFSKPTELHIEMSTVDHWTEMMDIGGDSGMRNDGVGFAREFRGGVVER